MAEFDDYELGTGNPEEPPPYRPEPEKKPGGMLFPALLALAGVAAIGLLALLFMMFKEAPEPEATPTPAPMAPPVATPAPTPTPVVLPPLEDSDDIVRQLLAALSSNEELARWLGQTELIRTLTVVTVNVATGESPKPHLKFLAPRTQFAATQTGRTLIPNPDGFAGYDVMADAFASMDAGAMAATYRTLEPLFETAFEEFGMPDTPFRAILDRAIQNLLAVPVMRADVELVPHATSFRYKNPAYEQLSPAQRQFLRMGPRNVRIIQGQLKGVAAALAASPAPAEAGGG